VKVTTLIENRPSATDALLASEWGLSLHVERSGRPLLFDTGSSGAFADNAKRLSVDLASVDAAVLSHHHYDHGGGLRRFFEVNGRAKVYMGAPPDGECVGRLYGFLKKRVGLDPSLLRDHADRIEVEGLARAVLDHPIGMTYTGHCTGDRAFKILEKTMGGRISDLRTGTCFEA